MTEIVRDKSSKGGQATVAWIIAVITIGYMLPWAIAASRGKANSGAIGWLNLFLGWSIIGWIVALVMACGAHQVVGTTQPVSAAPAPLAAPAPPPGLSPLAPGTPAAWTNDGTGTLRWWDGAGWTDHVHVPEPAPAPAPSVDPSHRA